MSGSRPPHTKYIQSAALDYASRQAWTFPTTAKPNVPTMTMPDTVDTPAPPNPPQTEPAIEHAHATDSPLDGIAATPESPEAAEASIDLKALTDRALHFLATASNETLGACLAGLGAGTYLILGRVGLVLIGVVGGVVLHATWEGYHSDVQGGRGKSAEARKRELGADIAQRVLDWRNSHSLHDTAEKHDSYDLNVQLYSGKKLDYSDFRPETAAALTELTDAVIRDYVKWWYSPLLPTEESFPNSCRQTLTAFVLSVSAHVSPDNFVDFVTRSSSFIIILLQEIVTAIQASPGDFPTEAVDLTLANILDPDYQMKQFSTYNCAPARIFLHQILAKLVLEMIPEWINGWIVQLLEAGEPELLNAIDAGVEGSSGQLPNAAVDAEKTPHSRDMSFAEKKEHKRVVSKAQEAMDDAMREAQRLSQMIAEEDAKRLQEQYRQSASTSTLNDDQSESTTQGIVTPSSSGSDTHADFEPNDLGISGLSSPSSPLPKLAEERAKEEEAKQAFTSFDQLVLPQPPTALMDNPMPAERPPPLTLHNSIMSIFDDSMPGEKGNIKSKPTAEYLIQIEPKSNHHTGWMTARKYSEFETLHEVMRRIAAITGATGFSEAHPSLPTWKGHTKASLRGELERYLNDAVQYQSLAESEGMKRFLDKELGSGKSPGGGFPGMNWAGQTFDTVGKGMLGVLTKAPKEVAGGGKALFGGVSGVLNSVTAPLSGKKNRDSVINATSTPTTTASPALSRTSTSTAPTQTRDRAQSTVSELPTHIRSESTLSLVATKRTSMDSVRDPNSPVIDQQPTREAPMERRPSCNPEGDGKRSGRSSRYGSRTNSRAPSTHGKIEDLSPMMGGDQILNLPPMPSEIPDDYMSRDPPEPTHSQKPSRTSIDSTPSLPRRTSTTSITPSSPSKSALRRTRTEPTYTPLSETETTVVIELFFAVIQELYTLSSAWTLRRTLLNAAKTYLLRPSNPQLSSITSLLQTTVFDDNTSDTGIAYHIRKIRENGLPTEDELKTWPEPMSEEEKEKLRVKARKLLVERGMPQALTSVMGQAASGEALGKVFDCLQDQRVARGVMFGLVLQGLRAVTQ
ncbi:sorting nexin C terminal-domain-containing protein [Bipolaris maydis]|nr:sorting nexin C terminal-domain-containing protein [Bipolaris maydis]